MASDKGKTVVSLFSGGDAPGMNSFLRALVRVGLNRYGAAVLGVKDGYDGLVRTCRRIANGTCTVKRLREEIDAEPGRAGLDRRGQDLVRFDHRSVSGIVGRGGIVLGSARCPEFHEPDCRRQVIELLKDLDVDAVVVCGGDGSLRGARVLAEESDLPVIGVPATIDNDISLTEIALGVDTAVNTIVWAVEHFNDTASSHHRIMVLETMGRESGELARFAALASGAEIVVTPERGALTERKMHEIAQRLETSMHRGRDHGIVLVAEGVATEPPLDGGPAHALAASLRRYFGRLTSLFPKTEVRVSVLGHLQRGGHPTAADRILASQLAESAWEAIADDGAPSGILALANGQIRLESFHERSQRVKMSQADKLYALQKTLSKW